MNKDAPVIDSMTVSNRVDAHAEAVRRIDEDPMKITGHVQVSVQRWHDDVNGPLFVNGRQGYYTRDESEDQLFPSISYNLLTEDGRDEFHQQCYLRTAASARGSGFIAVSAEGTAPIASDTALAGEIIADGLERADADTKTHTDNTNVSVIANTFTATGAHVAVHKAALFNVAGPPVAPIMSHAAVFTSDVTLAINDTLTVTWTNTLG